jgi:hypothetical protein
MSEPEEPTSQTTPDYARPMSLARTSRAESVFGRILDFSRVVVGIPLCWYGIELAMGLSAGSSAHVRTETEAFAMGSLVFGLSFLVLGLLGFWRSKSRIGK